MTRLWVYALGFVLGSSIALAKSGADEIRITVAGGSYQGIFARIKQPFQEETGTKLIFVGNVDSTGTEEIVRLVESEESEAGVTASNWRDIPDILKKKNIKVKNFDEYKYQTIGLDRTQVVLDKTNPLNELTDEQLVELFTGKIRTWKTINGLDLPVKIVLSTAQGASLHFFAQKVLSGKAIAKPDIDLKEISAVPKTVAETPGAIGLTSFAFAGGGEAKFPKHREIGRPITLFTKSKPSEKIIKLIHWIRTDGQKFVLH